MDGEEKIILPSGEFQKLIDAGYEIVPSGKAESEGDSTIVSIPVKILPPVDGEVENEEALWDQVARKRDKIYDDERQRIELAIKNGEIKDGDFISICGLYPIEIKIKKNLSISNK